MSSRSPEATRDRQTLAAAAARQALAAFAPAKTAYVEYRTRGSLLIIGDAHRALKIADTLKRTLRVIAVTDAPETGREPRGVTVVRGRVVELNGYLGRFTATAAGPREPLTLAPFSPNQDGCFDFVLDLSEPPLLSTEVPPLGYFAAGDDDKTVQRVLQAVARLGDKFSKPKYFDYKPERCAHGRKGITGCERCLEACPAGAIVSAGATVQVDPYLCQGCGTCTAVCPSGAISYAYPPPGETHDRLWAMLEAFRAAGGVNPRLVFYEPAGSAQFSKMVELNSPVAVLPFAVTALASIGIDTWLTALAHGAADIVLLAGGGTPYTSLTQLGLQVDTAQRMLAGMGHEQARIQLLAEDEPGTMRQIFNFAPPESLTATRFAGLDDKRTAALRALDHLSSLVPSAPDRVKLPEGSAFGELQLDRDTCTMCLACAGLCPTGALQAGQHDLELTFIEAACVQCALCSRGCPEKAIRLVPRFLCAHEQRGRARVLNTADMVRCIECGSPFMPRALLEASLARVKDNPAFRGDAERLFKTCPACRANATMLAQVLHNRPPAD